MPCFRAVSVIVFGLVVPFAALGVSTARAAIEGYCSPLSAAPGETVSFMVSSSSSYTVTFARYRRLGESNESIPVTTPQSMPGGLQTIPPSAWEGCAWTPSFLFTIPAGWSSGIYAAECSSPGLTTFRITFVVKPSPTDLGDFAVLANTNTWNAYNDWGGRGKYTNPPAHYLSFLRPNVYARSNGGGQNHLTRAELWVLDWLTSSGYDIDLYSDLDFHLGNLDLHLYKGLILNTHPEYWTHEMMDRLENYIATGGSVLYIGGNGLYERTVFSPDGNTLELFPQNFCGTQACRRESYFRNHLPPRPERAVLGVAYRTDNFQTFAPFQVLQASHRFFAGTGVTNGSAIGAAGLNGGGASGWEMDTSIPGLAPDGVMVYANGSDDRGSPPVNLELLARGTNLSGGNTYGADMTYYRAASGGGVFAAGSLSFGGSLVIDAQLQQIIRNVLDEFLLGPLSVVPRGGKAPAESSALRQNIPNPFSGTTTIRFDLAREGHVRLRVFDVAGRQVRTLLDDAPRAARGVTSWDGRDDAGRAVAGGIYVVRLETRDLRESRRMLLLR